MCVGCVTMCGLCSNVCGVCNNVGRGGGVAVGGVAIYVGCVAMCGCEYYVTHLPK